MTTSLSPDDELLLSRIASQDQAALSRLYDRYARLIFSVAYQTLRSAEESEEVVLDVFAQVWRIAARYDATRGRVDTWLFTLARSRVLDRLRKLQRRGRLATRSLESLAIQPATSGVDPTEDLLISERRSQVLKALDTLPVEQRLVVELAYYQGLSHSQIAAQTGISLGTVKTRMRLGLSKLKSALSA